MRKSPLLSALLPRTTQLVLAATVLRPGREWYLSDLAGHLAVTPSSLQRVLAKLVEAGILARRDDGNRTYYRVDGDCPILDELAGILVKTVGLIEPLREAIAPMAARIRVAFVHGSIAEGRERAGSDVDVIVVGDAPSADLAFALRPMNERLGRAVNFTRYSPKEFTAKVADGHHFLSAVLGRPRIFLIGGTDELDQLAGRETRIAGAHEQARTG
jgi:predicted nucleotidyltransferase